MNNEIKEILNLLKRCDNTYLKIEDSEGKINYEYKKVNDLRLDGYHSQILLDYITNLQQENEDNSRCIKSLKEQLESVIKNNQELLEKWHKNNDKIVNLISENERLKKALNCKEYFSSTMPEDTEFVILTKNNYDRQQKDIQLELIDYKSRCEKAIQYMNNDKSNDHADLIEDLLNILQNGSDDND